MGAAPVATPFAVSLATDRVKPRRPIDATLNTLLWAFCTLPPSAAAASSASGPYLWPTSPAAVPAVAATTWPVDSSTAPNTVLAASRVAEPSVAALFPIHVPRRRSPPAPLPVTMEAVALPIFCVNVPMPVRMPPVRSAAAPAEAAAAPTTALLAGPRVTGCSAGCTFALKSWSIDSMPVLISDALAVTVVAATLAVVPMALATMRTASGTSESSSSPEGSTVAPSEATRARMSTGGSASRTTRT
mmetsp:Transcript_4822/g.13338  ORF Transcript_4822/g.13338 Transcript_4822/m.13338 type:complete len:245 (-) Transcript_4822:315-1049(-)